MYINSKIRAILLMLNFLFIISFSSACDKKGSEPKPDENGPLPKNEINVLEFKNSSKNDQDMIQKAIDYAAANHIKVVVIPDGEYEIDAAGVAGPKGLSMKDNLHLKLSDKAILKAIPNNAANYSILRIQNVSNVIVSGGVFKGERDGHTGEGGEWGMGIDIRVAKNVEVKNTLVKDCWGDGIYIAGSSRDVLVDNVVCDNNRRQGISVINVDGLIIKSSVFSNTNGAAPQAGIDLEPNEGDHIKNVKIENCDFENNQGLGLHIYGKYGSITSVVVEDIRANNNPIGVSMRYDGANNIKLSNVHISDSRDQGLRVFQGAKDVEMTNVKILNSLKNAITLTEASGIQFSDFTVEGYKQGLLLDQSTNVNLASFVLSTEDNTAMGFEIKNSSDLNLDKIKINNGKVGISSLKNSKLSIFNSEMKGQKDNGVLFSETSNSVINSSLFVDIEQSALRLVKSTSNKINSNQFIGNAFMPDNIYTQVYFEDTSKDNEFKQNSLKKGTKSKKPKYGVWLIPSTSGNVVSQNTIDADSYHTEAIKNEGTNQIN